MARLKWKKPVGATEEAFPRSGGRKLERKPLPKTLRNRDVDINFTMLPCGCRLDGTFTYEAYCEALEAHDCG